MSELFPNLVQPNKKTHTGVLNMLVSEEHPIPPINWLNRITTTNVLQ